MGWRLQIVGFEPDKKMILSFFGAGTGGVPGRGRQRRELGGGGVVRSRAQGAAVVGVRAEGIGVRAWGGGS